MGQGIWNHERHGKGPLGGRGSCRAAGRCIAVPSWCSVVPGWGAWVRCRWQLTGGGGVAYFHHGGRGGTRRNAGGWVAEFSEPRKARKARKTNLRCLRSVAELRQPLAAVVSPQTSLPWSGVFIAAEGRRKTRKNAVWVWNHERHERHGKRPFGRARLLPSRGLVQAGTELVLGGPGGWASARVVEGVQARSWASR